MRLQLANAPHVVGTDDAASALAPRDAALLAWLALEGPTPRTRLAALLWPQSTPESAGNALRQRLFQLRRQLGVDGSGNVITVWSQSDGTRTNIWANGFR